MSSTGNCHRKGCGTAGCDTWLDTLGFICSGCCEEFKNIYVKACSKHNKVLNIYACLTDFMVLDKNPKILDTSKLPGTVDNFFEIHKINIDEHKQ